MKSKEAILAKHEGCSVETINDSERILIGQDVILPAMEEYAQQFGDGPQWIKASERLPADVWPQEIVFRNIITERVLDVHSYWTDTQLELNDADILGKPVGTLVLKSEVEWLDESGQRTHADEPVKVKLSDGLYGTYSTLKDKSIPEQWHQLWHEIEVWYGDITRKESADNLVKRLQQIINDGRTPADDAVEFTEWLDKKGYRIHGWDRTQRETIYKLFKGE